MFAFESHNLCLSTLWTVNPVAGVRGSAQETMGKGYGIACKEADR